MAKQEVRRGRKFVEYHDPDTQDPHTFTQEISGADVSYQDENGAWLPANENWETDGVDGFILKNDKLNHKVRLKGTGGRTWYPRRNVATEYMTFGIPQYRNGTKWSNFRFSGWSVEGKTITLQTRQGVTILVHNRWNGIKIDWVLASSSAPSRMRYPVSLTGITYVDGIIYGADSTRLGQLTPTTATDANGAELPCSGSFASGYVEFQADVTGAVYPVTIDPDFSVQPDPTAGQDAYIWKGGKTTNYGATITLPAGLTSGDSLYRSLIKFDLSSIPSASIVSSSSISLFYRNGTDGVSNTVNFYRQLKAWVEAQTTWNIYSTGNDWTAAGGFNSADCEQAEIGAITISNVTFEMKTISLTASKVQEWISGTLTNNGLLFKTTDETTTNGFKTFWSSDYTDDTAKRPTFSVTYTAAGGFHPINMTANMQSLSGNMRG